MTDKNEKNKKRIAVENRNKKITNEKVNPVMTI